MKATTRIVCIFLTLSRLSLSLPIPETEPSYKSGPNGRGTIDLLWTCLLTFGLCVWTVFHPNVIPWTKPWAQIRYRMGAMIGAVLFPEVVVLFALGQLLQAKEVLKSWNLSFDGDVERWLGRPGAFFVVMGGFVVDVRLPERDPTDGNKEHGTNMQVLLDRQSSGQRQLIDELLNRRRIMTIRPDGFCKLLEEDWFRDLVKTQTLPKAYFSYENIQDKGKADSIAKFLVTVQILWMCIQCLGRELIGLPITLLEGHILIQILFSVVAYALWWDKPLDVAEPIWLPLPLDKLLPLIPPHNSFYRKALFISEHAECGGFFHLLCRATYDAVNYNTPQLEACVIFMGLVNGGLHAIAWTSHFPTATEQLLWRISCIGTGTLLPTMFLLMWMNGSEPYIVRELLNMNTTAKRQGGGFRTFAVETWRAAKSWHQEDRICIDDPPSYLPWPAWLPKRARILGPILFFTCTLAYLFSILYLTVESFLSTRSLPKGAYSTVEWSDFIPHI